ncbi:MAG: pentapeptide repeat-containing protein, partial [Anaerolineales bacterium]
EMDGALAVKPANVTFEEAKLEGTIFKRCDMTAANLRNADLKEADLRGSTLDGLQVSAQDMQGAIITPTQAIQVAGLLGVAVMDEEL